MKNLQIIIAVICFTIFSMQNSFAQIGNKNTDTVYKTSKSKTPQKVKESLKEYSDYKISNEVTYTKSNKINVYKFRVEKGNWSHFLLINENGKIIGIETGEH
jgi:hypothetical protein